jgi:hypothetical protein
VACGAGGDASEAENTVVARTFSALALAAHSLCPIVRLSTAEENAIADLAEQSAELRARADLLETEIATEAGALLDRFIAGEDLAKDAPA